MLKSMALRSDELTLQNRLNEPQYIEIRSDAADYEMRLGERNVLVGQLSELRRQIIAAYELEDQEAQMAMARNIDPDGLTAEQREFHKLGQRTSIVEYMNAGFHQRALTPGTAEHEYNSHVFGSNWGLGEFPVEMFLDRAQYFSMEAHLAAQIFEQDMEQRTEVTGVVGTAGNLSFVDRIFANSEGAYCRAVYPAVGPGRHSYPIVTGTGQRRRGNRSRYWRDRGGWPHGGQCRPRAHPALLRGSQGRRAPDAGNHGLPRQRHSRGAHGRAGLQGHP